MSHKEGRKKTEKLWGDRDMCRGLIVKLKTMKCLTQEEKKMIIYSFLQTAVSIKCGP
jgi:hypothetical protein